MASTFALVGYALASVFFLALAVLASVSWRGRRLGSLLIAAALLSAIWAGLLALSTLTPNVTRFHIFLIETLRSGSWLLFLIVVLRGGIGGQRFHVLRSGGVWLVAVLLAIGIGIELAARASLIDYNLTGLLSYGSLVIALYALVLAEQVYRNARDSQRQGLNYLCLAIAGLFAYDLVLYSNAILFGRINSLLWNSRGYVVALCVPLIALAARSTPSWSVGIFVSRQIVFYTATLFGAGLYLTSMALVGYYVRIFGGDWGPAAQIVFIAAATLAFALFAVSVRARSWLRVFISKHFFENKYDYRKEWLRLINTLTNEENAPQLQKRGIKALAQILGASAGVLWINHSKLTSYRCAAGWNVPVSNEILPADTPLATFLGNTGWIIDIVECRENPERYKTLLLDEAILGIENPGYVVPLIHEGLFGFVVLAESVTPGTLNFEDHDLLKTAGKQIASYLAQEQATDRLAESRQFEAFSKFTAYIMHDLRNVMAQQSLIIENAEKHKGNPEFIDDAIETLKGGNQRMRRVMEHLQPGSVEKEDNIEVGKLALEAISSCADRQPVPIHTLGDEQVWVRGGRDRLLMALCHAIRNAQDATAPDGEICLSVDLLDGDCSITVADTGEGMDNRFIQERLFRPFDSTKGTKGMGIGAHQIRETVRAIGGDVFVTSTPGAGTRMTIRLPLYQATARAKIADG